MSSQMQQEEGKQTIKVTAKNHHNDKKKKDKNNPAMHDKIKGEANVPKGLAYNSITDG